MKLIHSLVRTSKLDDVKSALCRLNVRGLATIEMKDHSPQEHPTGVWRGQPYRLDFTPKAWLELVVDDDDVDDVVTTIIATARTGQAGDGHVCVIPLEHRYEIRTGARGASD